MCRRPMHVYQCERALCNTRINVSRLPVFAVMVRGVWVAVGRRDMLRILPLIWVELYIHSSSLRTRLNPLV